LINYVLVHPSLSIGQGVYKNRFNLETPSIPQELFLRNVTATDLQNVEFRYRTSSDGSTWGTWSNWLKYTERHTIDEILDSLTMFFEYEIRLFGDYNFDGPSVGNDLVCRYFKPADFVIFFKPQGIGGSDNISAQSVNDNIDYGIEEGRRFISSIHVTHEADIPETSVVEYGITQSDTNEFDTFYTPIEPDEHTIMLTRYNEPLVTDDNRIFKALNGNWPDGVGISIYKINTQYPNGQLVDPQEYAANNIEGSITFYNTQNSNNTYVICIEISPSFRLACKVVNYGNARAVIHHIGVIYNMMKRIPTAEDGSIIHTPISSRIS